MDTMAQDFRDMAPVMDKSPQLAPSLQPRSTSAENNVRMGHWTARLPQRGNGKPLEKDWGF